KARARWLRSRGRRNVLISGSASSMISIGGSFRCGWEWRGLVTTHFAKSAEAGEPSLSHRSCLTEAQLQNRNSGAMPGHERILGQTPSAMNLALVTFAVEKRIVGPKQAGHAMHVLF